MKRYKLVTQDYKTRVGYYNETTWEIGKTVKATGDKEKGLCSDAYVHCYDSPELAVFLNPTHANIFNPRMLVVETHGRGINDRGLKRGYRSMTPVREIYVPRPTNKQITAFGLLCAKQVCDDDLWNKWADDWLSGKAIPGSQGPEAPDGAAHYASWAVWYYTQNPALEAVYIASYVAEAAFSAAYLNPTIDFVAIAHKAMQM